MSKKLQQSIYFRHWLNTHFMTAKTSEEMKTAYGQLNGVIMD
jgi:hypothetical protein